MRSAFAVILTLVLLVFHSGTAHSSTETLDSRIQEMEAKMKALDEEMRAIQELKGELKTLVDEHKKMIEEQKSPVTDSHSGGASHAHGDPADGEFTKWYDRFTLGGYGEIHGNFNEGDGGDQLDFHRFVIYAGYEFNDWIQLHSEVEVEHAYVTDGAGGELVFEQLYADFLVWEELNFRVGRVLTPMGIVNQKHEPPSFYGVERPSFARYIIPTTWSSDGVGIFGSLSPALSYEAYIVAGLDGSGFSDINGIRGGRIKERPSFNDPAFTGRVDYFPFAFSELGDTQLLRLGLSGYAGGIDNGNRGRNPGIDGSVQIVSADFEYALYDFNFRGVMAFGNIDGAADIGNNTASEIFGWYLEAAYHFWPDEWKNGILDQSDAAVFVRYDDYDTQFDMPDGVVENPLGDRHEWTFGFNFYPTTNVVLKLDYQLRFDEALNSPDNQANVGLGWQF